MTCHVTNQINQHMSERDNDEALTIEALRDKCDELEAERDKLRAEVDRKAYPFDEPWLDGDVIEWPIAAQCNYYSWLANYRLHEISNMRHERDRLQSTVAALERERDELSEEIESIHELIDAHYGLSVRETSMECLKPRVLQLIKEKSELRSQLANCCHAIRFEFKMNGIVACLHKALLHAELAEPKETK